MLSFKDPELADRSWAALLLAAEPALSLEYCFASVYLWRKIYAQRIARFGDRLLVRVEGSLGPAYLYPAGSGPLAPALDAMGEDAAAQNVPLLLVCVTEEQKAAVEAACPGRFEFEAHRDSFDYLYDVDRLADLPGKKLHAKRNHISHFDARFPDWTSEPVTAANVGECMELERQWNLLHLAEERREIAAGEDTISEESAVLMDALKHMGELGMEGVLLRAEGEPVAFSLGGLITPECFDVNFEKSFGDVQGAYAAVNREMARRVREVHPGVKWLNREDDMGLEGLRKAKLSYYPDILLTKYVAREVRP